MEKGKIIFLNGVTSSGKTSIVEALQDTDDIFFYVVANDSSFCSHSPSSSSESVAGSG